MADMPTVGSRRTKLAVDLIFHPCYHRRLEGPGVISMIEGEVVAPTAAEVLSRTRKHATVLANLAQRHGFETLSYFLFVAAKQAEKELRALGHSGDEPAP
jgi:hypothetical protein